jgi:hypothetical protein
MSNILSIITSIIFFLIPETLSAMENMLSKKCGLDH